ncbi:DUF6291 domain-containing protein [Elizabethkingia miricola]|uniref:DUF6291 domain-containing protein n=1 Tax=Elizabethkingia miricola TaxID=172045 RepID=UPI002018A38F|nr:DUF6291 domain-containing protein [Elizabethkingia miricola]MCL1657430.1 DUF6291 domain-containing protein [Elizabethkingia miricola]
MQKDSFILYKSFYEPLKMLSDKQLGKLFKAIFEYQINDCISVDPDIQMAFAFIKNQMDLDNVKYQEKVRKNKENGQRGGRPPKKDIIVDKPNGFNETQKSERLFTEPKKAYNENDNEYDNDILLEKESKGVEVEESVQEEKKEIEEPDKNSDPDLSKKVAPKKVFRIPSVQEVQDYCNERDNGISGYAFVNFYQAKGWMVGKNKMKDWQAAIRTWEQTRKENGHNQTTSSGSGNKGPVQANQVQRRNNQFTIDDFTVPS